MTRALRCPSNLCSGLEWFARSGERIDKRFAENYHFCEQYFRARKNVKIGRATLSSCAASSLHYLVQNDSAGPSNCRTGETNFDLFNFLAILANFFADVSEICVLPAISRNDFLWLSGEAVPAKLSTFCLTIFWLERLRRFELYKFFCTLFIGAPFWFRTKRRGLFWICCVWLVIPSSSASRSRLQLATTFSSHSA